MEEAASFWWASGSRFLACPDQRAADRFVMLLMEAWADSVTLDMYIMSDESSVHVAVFILPYIRRHPEPRNWPR